MTLCSTTQAYQQRHVTVTLTPSAALWRLVHMPPGMGRGKADSDQRVHILLPSDHPSNTPTPLPTTTTLLPNTRITSSCLRAVCVPLLQYGDTPLHRAALAGHAAVVALLLTAPGVDPRDKNRVRHCS